ncbi:MULTISPECIES: serine/threonine-protein kinase [Leptolyngbya]|jgi:serine/threonine-protein kinase|uniref:Serine/threonine-protein kinase B n=2 Tax=Leptolyngbya boryana TaxID=1184 RepID=A0A1Z4JMV5_LEPBY|nr:MULTISPECIES: serine/threonine-protein kinase [Leptolyngbya]BAY58036.1 serine/threonine protein kinase with pentapeptide repeats [Leptolyngbya boryana NIES-2135]MBD1858336.1 pentapeptide repeat-containing protein [Leptolyngbya sp. FACHB-1624]MBD2367479.1 pentapeptide repeat-containing protein [Leptolyngbya sp. FACHB-161]MBD2374003.1 pentapeptide repeat-containing protein [Leptolyngbya sp. FACHB-238]MBD2398197.1 pentapeptide repeat-containing protein [Leptolyngbya sp. FACHB-239]
MSYCLNPVCPSPENLANTERCQACGASLLLRDRYRVLHALGQGGFGATFLAKDESLPGQPYCVIKQLRPTTTAPHVMQMARDLFEREAQTLGRIGNHPQIPRLLDYFEANQEFYLVQEYISGSTLQQEIKRSGAFSEAGVKQFLSEILPIMQYVHSHQVIHRDLKPANLIRRSQDCKLVLIDFGAVKNQVNSVSAASLSDQTALTAYAIGTPGFAPPEQMAMRPVYASDLYALGVTCIYLLTAKSPKDLDYDPATGELLWQKQVHLSEHFAGVLKKMLEVSVRHRFQSANEILRALDLEPYLDSLANSMNSVSTRSTLTKRDPDSQPSSPAARAAMAIRARNQRSESTNLQTGVARNRVMAARPTTRDSGGRTGSNSNTSGNKTQAAPKLDSATLVSLYGKGKRDFASHDLSLLAIPKINLSGAVFHQSNLKQINLQGANLFNADFGKASLQRANLRDTNLAQAYLSNADLEGADLRGANLTQAYLLNANLRNANLCGANLTGAKLTAEQLAMAKTNWLTVRPNGKRGIL